MTWAHVIVVMEKAHRTKLQRKVRKALNRQRVICLDIPDEYELTDAELLRRLRAKMARYLRTT